jgi:hypothetical protein
MTATPSQPGPSQPATPSQRTLAARYPPRFLLQKIPFSEQKIRIRENTCARCAFFAPKTPRAQRKMTATKATSSYRSATR